MKYLYVVLFLAAFQLQLMGQEAAPISSDSLQEHLQQLGQSQRRVVLAYALFQQDSLEIEQAVSSLWSELTPEQQVDLLFFIDNYEGEAKSFFLSLLRNHQSPTNYRATSSPSQQGKASSPQLKPNPGPLTTLSFDETSYDFGELEQGEKATHLFTFTNTGKEQLLISYARGSCGCTIPEWPKDPIGPGQQGQIKVVFDSQGKLGWQKKKVTITANTDPAETLLFISGKVIQKP